MVDKGFWIEDKLVEMGFKLNIFLFVIIVYLMSVVNVILIRKIVVYRIYVERVIN